jgi:hypothetical protein
MLKGFSVPLTPQGKSALATLPPWHYSSDWIAIEYWTDLAAIAALCRSRLRSITGAHRPLHSPYTDAFEPQVGISTLELLKRRDRRLRCHS